MSRSVPAMSVLLLALCGAVLARQTPTEGPVREIKMTAKKYEFNPGEIRVKQGERIRLLITATDRKHGIRIKELGVRKVELPKGEETAVEFVADKAGEFEFKCAVRCGWRHGRMKGKLIVEPVSE